MSYSFWAQERALPDTKPAKPLSPMEEFDMRTWKSPEVQQLFATLDLEREKVKTLREALEAQRALAEAIQKKVDQMTADGRAFTLTDEEERIIKSFRRFKANCKKDGEIFKWQTRRTDGVIEAPEIVFVRDAQEVS